MPLFNFLHRVWMAVRGKYILFFTLCSFVGMLGAEVFVRPNPILTMRSVGICFALACITSIVMYAITVRIARELVSSDAKLHTQVEENILKARTAQKELQNVLNILDCGVVRMIFYGDMKRHIQWANEGFYNLTGYGKEGYDQDVDENPHKILHPDDIQWVFKAFNNHVYYRDTLTLEYRVIHKDGHVVWLYVKSNFVGEENGFPVFICVMLDVTEQRQLRDTLDWERRRYALVSGFSDDMLFEYNAHADILSLFGNSQNLLGHSCIEHFTDSLRASGLVHQDDLEAALQIAQSSCAAEGVRSTDKFRVLHADGEYRWCYALYAHIDNTCTGHPTIIGKLVNIHESTKKIEELERRSSLDGMTGVYNKTAVEKVIAQALDNDGCHALMIVDIDNFKAVNDTYGHALGDEVIKTIVYTLRESFRSTDIIGRIGGDEFIVLLKDIKSPEYISERLQRYFETLHSLRLETHPEFSFSTSIGVALYPEHGKGYHELFLTADAALYAAKWHNKGGFIISK